MRHLTVVVKSAVLAGLCVSVPSSVLGDWPEFLPGVQVGTVEDTAIDEASGIAASRANPGVLWAHNDSGDPARVFAMDTSGIALGTYSIVGAGATDWEDMALGPGPTTGQQYLYLGDIGDNNALRGGVLPPIVVYRVPEPDVPLNQTPGSFSLHGAEAVTLTYPDGARDAETLMVDPITGDVYVVSKRETYSRVYRVPADQFVDGTTVTMEFKAALPWGWATGGDISPDGQWIVIRGYSNASLWTRPAEGDLWDVFSETPETVPLVWEPQGEAIGVDPDTRGYYTLSEGTDEPIYYFESVLPPAGDATLDYCVDGLDYVVWSNNYETGTTWEQGDFTGEGYVDGLDYVVWSNNYGQGCPGAPGPVPEPAGLLLLALGGFALIRRRGGARRQELF